MGKYKYKFGNGLAFFEEKDIKMCEEFASKGYKLVGVPFGFYKFERSQPEEASFAVDYTDKALKNEELAEYIQIFESKGWNHVFSIDKYHYFKAEKGTVPIYTDDVTKLHKLEMLLKISVQCTIMGITLAAASLIVSIIIKNLFLNLNPLIFNLLSGVGLGIAIAMVGAIILNKTRIAKLKKRIFLS